MHQGKTRRQYGLYLLLRRKDVWEMRKFEILLMDEAKDFISSLPPAAAYKIYYNMKRIASG